ncbi:MAG: hypothetical protein ACR2RV_01430 [Verrucomicrobiales bacterium]
MTPLSRTLYPALALLAGQLGLIAAPTLNERFEQLQHGYEKVVLENGVAAGAAESDLLGKYAAALERLKAGDAQIAGKPLREAAVDAELAAVQARLKGEELVVEKADPPPFTFPRTLEEWEQAPGDVFEVDLADRETRLGKPLGMTVRQGDRIRVIPNPIDKIKRGGLSGGWKGIDRGWIGLRIQDQTRTTHLRDIGKNDFIYSANCDGELAAVVYIWDSKSGGGIFRIKLINLDAPDESEEARMPRSFVDLKAKGDSLLGAAEEKAGRVQDKSLEIYASSLRQLARDAKAKRDPLLADIEKELVRVGGVEGPPLIYESDPFQRPRNASEWEAQPGKVVVVEAADPDWRDPKRVGLAVSKGDKVRLVFHPADLWGRGHWVMGTWSGADRCSLRVGIVGQTEFEGPSRGGDDSGTIYECLADGQLAFQTYLWATSGGLGKLRIKLQPLAKDPA